MAEKIKRSLAREGKLVKALQRLEKGVVGLEVVAKQAGDNNGCQEAKGSGAL